MRKGDRRAAIEHWQNGLTMLETRGGKMAVHQAGMGSPIVFLHGIPTHSWLWRDVVAHLAPGAWCIAPDLAGFGFSQATSDADLTPKGQADAIEDVLAALDIDTFTLVAHDYGALIAGELLVRHPEHVERLVLTNTSYRTEDWGSASPLNPLAVFKVPVLGETALRLSRPFMLKAAMSVFVADRSRLTDETMALYWHPFENGFDGTLLRLSRESNLGEDEFHRWKAALYDFQRPALVVWGAKDPAFKMDRAHEITRLLPDCRFESFANSNHYIQEDRPHALARLIGAFTSGTLGD